MNSPITENRISGMFHTDELTEATLSVLEAKGRKDDYEIFHKTYADAATEAYWLAGKRGYEIDEDSWVTNVNTGPRKPSEGKFVELKVDLNKNGKPVKHMLVFQVYNLGNKRKTPYELTAYIS